MEGKSGSERWCMLRRAGCAHDNKMSVDQIMLGFRPIAPKPVTGGDGSGNLLGENKDSLVSTKRSKRKYVKVRKNNNGYRRKKNKKAEMVTLQLLPEREKVDEEDSRRRSESCCNEKAISKTNHGDQEKLLGFGVGGDQVMEVESWVTVESVIGALIWKDDAELMKNLDKDTCPGFISGGVGSNHNVKWLNDAFKNMVTGRNEANANEKLAGTVVVKVELVMKEKLPSWFAPLTCRARVEYTWQKEKKSKVVLCDVWRMECGGYAWRLDFVAALSLGR